MATLPTLESLKKVENVEVQTHLGMRTVRCQLTGALLAQHFAAVPVPKKNGKVVWRGTFVDYETVMTYLSELLAANSIKQETFDDIKGHLVQHLDFVPQTAANIRYTELAPLGTKSLSDWQSAYAPASTLSPGAFFMIPSEKSKSEPKEKRYTGRRAVSNKSGISTEGAPIAFTTNNIASVVAPWGDEEEAKSKAFSFLVSMDGARPPKKVIVAQCPTPQHQAKVIGLPGAKDGMEVFVLESAAKPEKVKKEKKAKTEEPHVTEAPVKKVATKKRKVAEATA